MSNYHPFYFQSVPDASKWLTDNKYRGDFLSIWTRPADKKLFDQLERAWLDDSRYKLLRLMPEAMPGGARASLDTLRPFETFLRSDHASFWYHKHGDFEPTLPAVLLTDMGEYSSMVDNSKNFDSIEHLNRFLKSTMVRVCGQKSMTTL